MHGHQIIVEDLWDQHLSSLFLMVREELIRKNRFEPTVNKRGSCDQTTMLAKQA